MRATTVIVLICVAACPVQPLLAQSVLDRADPVVAEKAKETAKSDEEEQHKPADPDTGTSTLSDETLGLLPNPWKNRGIKFSASYVGEVLGNPTGGLRRGAIYEGRLNLAVDLDLDKLARFSGTTFHANIFQSHGRGLSREYLGNLILVSSIEALATTRLYEMWLEKKVAGDKLTIRFGQLAADTEFFTSKYTDVFINSTFGWPTILGVDLPSGGPSPPLSAVGARLKYEINDSLTALAGVFNGNSAGPGVDDPQSRDRYGLNFRVSDGVFALVEAQYAIGRERGALPGTIKIGAWAHSGTFSDQRLAANSVSQASPIAAPTAMQVRGDYGLYGVYEQMLYAFPDPSGKRGLSGFLRAATNPGGRNLIDTYVDGGLNLAGLLDGRPDDKFGIGFAVARVSDRARELDGDYQALGDLRPTRSYERLFTAGYLAQVRQGWTVLPSLQYIVRPGGGYVLDAGQWVPGRRTVVLGLRSVMKF